MHPSISHIAARLDPSVPADPRAFAVRGRYRPKLHSQAHTHTPADPFSRSLTEASGIPTDRSQYPPPVKKKWKLPISSGQDVDRAGWARNSVRRSQKVGFVRETRKNWAPCYQGPPGPIPRKPTKYKHVPTREISGLLSTNSEVNILDELNHTRQLGAGFCRVEDPTTFLGSYLCSQSLAVIQSI